MATEVPDGANFEHQPGFKKQAESRGKQAAGWVQEAGSGEISTHSTAASRAPNSAVLQYWRNSVTAARQTVRHLPAA